LPTRDGWVAVNLARPEDVEMVSLLTGTTEEPWTALANAARSDSALRFRDRVSELQVPVAVVGESAALELSSSDGAFVPGRVVDMSALWAGPLCAGLLARVGATVTRIESLGRPDPTPLTTPRLDARINAAKRRVGLDLRTTAGRDELYALLAESDVVVTSARPAALDRLGLDPARWPHLTWVAITAHGFTGPGALRVGFGDDCAAAGGLLDWKDDQPRFLGDAVADPLTGLEAALCVLAGRRGLIDVPLARVAAAWAEALG
jgi:hypothetical protein